MHLLPDKIGAADFSQPCQSEKDYSSYIVHVYVLGSFGRKSWFQLGRLSGQFSIIQ